MDNCIFCKIVKGESPCKKVYESDNFFGFLDKYGLVDGHSMVIPKKHYKNFLDMPASLGNELIDALKEVGVNLIKEGKAEAFNILVNNGEIAGQVVPHLHFHVIPRKRDDGLKGFARN
ncbi:MAG: HIT family protein [Candidatus Nanoarchaeia archaeon]|nr:HIT family protein [Candidatus Nanoarchaeia archaeon]